ncbi:MAG: glycoside hydrolase family 11 protein [Fibrobacter sp.]|uniref:glycoside hydrolase family 11 protein n=1 Tax=Fibrobacter sp. TaxID=35828 RepID=UPI0025C05B98|nr:glycoside hydrolase family 11 protein [Fibrobacter sp.]MBQ9225124.1 glycoside hydrolase family 11 protein [Fibrobacter sp.]
MKKCSLAGIGLAMTLGLAVSAFAADACNDNMGHTGNGSQVSGNRVGSINGTPWGYEQWYQGGNASMTYYSNGTFKANWSGSSDYLTRVGYQYNGNGISHKTKNFAVDYKYTKSGNAQYGYIGVYGWTKNPETEYYIVDDWFSKPSEQYVGEKFGEITVDGAKYSIHAFLRQQEPSKSGTSTFVQFFSIRETPRQCGHIDISAHFKKWDELFTGQQKQLRGSKGGGSASLKFGNVTEVMLMTEAGGNATGSVDYTYFNMVDNATPSPTSSASPKSSSSVAKSSSSKGGTAVSGTIDACKDAMGHEGQSKTDNGRNNSSSTGNIGSTGYHYEIWYQGGNNSMTYYDNGTYTAKWSGTNDFLARVGFKYNEDKTYDQVGPIDAYYKWSHQGSAGGYNYIGIYGWTVDPLVEYYIVDDWFNKPGANLLGQRKGEFTVDGDTYEIYQNTRYNAPSIKGDQTFPQYFSVRKSARQCGHIDITAHFKKWESLGMKMGKMYEAKVLVEAGGGTGSFDVTYFKMTDAKHPLPQPEPESSSNVAKSSSSGSAKSSSSRGGWNWGRSSSSTDAIPFMTQALATMDGQFLVFDMQGRSLGAIDVPAGSTVASAIKAKFKNTGIYLVKQGKTFLRVKVTP